VSVNLTINFCNSDHRTAEPSDYSSIDTNWANIKTAIITSSLRIVW